MVKVEISSVKTYLAMDPRDKTLGYRVQLQRARRALKRLAAATEVPLEDESAEALLDDIMSACVTLYHMMDWIERENGMNRDQPPLKDVLAPPDMKALRDLCDGGKHRGIDRPNRFPGPLMLHAEGELGKDSLRSYLAKVQLRLDTRDVPIMEFLEARLKDWVQFSIQHLGLPNKNGVPVDFTINDLRLNIEQALRFELTGELP